jgi:ATP-dependent DNA helicase RecQ
MADFQAKICEKFNIYSLTDNQNKSIMAIIDGKDVLVGTKTGSGKSLTYEAIPVVFPGSCVVIIAPLISIMSEQCKKLEGLGFNATYIGKDSSENDLIEKAEFDFIYGSPEKFVRDLKWRSVLLQSALFSMKAIVVDEAHTVIQW